MRNSIFCRKNNIEEQKTMIYNNFSENADINDILIRPILRQVNALSIENIFIVISSSAILRIKKWMENIYISSR